MGTINKRPFLFISILIIALTIVAAFLFVPPLTKKYITERVSQELKRSISVESISFNPLTLGLTIKGFRMLEPDGKSDFLSFDELYANIEAISLLKGAIITNAIALTNPYIQISRYEDNLYNFSDLIRKDDAPSEQDKRSLDFSINNISIKRGSLSFIDKPKGLTHQITDIDIALPFVSNMPHFQEIDINPSFKAKVNNRLVSFEGTTKPFSKSIETNLSINIKELDIPQYMVYLPDKPKFIIDSGLFNGDIKMHYVQYADKKPSLKLTGSLSISDLSLRALNKEKVAAFNNLALLISDSDMLSDYIHLSEVLIDSPAINLQLNEKGILNITKLLTAEKESPEPFIYEIDNLKVTGGNINFHDQGASFKNKFTNIELNLTNLSNRKGKEGNFTCSMGSGFNETLSLEGKVSIEPVAIEGTMRLLGVKINNYAPYYKKHVNLLLRDGRLEIAAGFKYSPEVRLISDLALHITALDVKNNEGNEIALIPSLSIKDSSVDLLKRQIRIGAIDAKRARLRVEKESGGTLNIENLITGDVSNEDKDKEGDETPWELLAKSIVLQGMEVLFKDLSQNRAVELAFKNIALRGSDISNNPRQKGNIKMSMDIPSKGRLALDSSITLSPPSMDASISIDAFDITSIGGYIGEHLNVLIPAGNIHLKGKFTALLPPEHKPNFTYKGEGSMRGLHLLDGRTSEDLLKWENLHINEIDLSAAPLSFSAKDIALSNFYSRLVITKEKRLNLQDLLLKPEKGQEETAGHKDDTTTDNHIETTPSVKINIGAVTLQKGALYFTDRHVEPNFSARLLELSGAISKLTSEEDKTSEIDIRGSLENYAPLQITGKINPFRKDLYLELKADFKDMGMTSLNPYSSKYLGYAIEKGKLSFEVKYLIDKGRLDSENNIFLDQLTLGEKIESPEATKLPVKLAIALLKDRKGEIKLDLPVKGSLKDPEFSLGGVIIKILINLLVKAATSPFALLGAMFGGGEELSFIEFDYGSHELRQDQSKKIELLAKALTDRPSLKLDIKGVADTEKDKEGLKRYQFNNKLKAQKLKEILSTGKTPPALSEITIEPSEYEKHLRSAYKEEDFPKPRNLIGIPKTLPVAEMEKLMLAHISVTDSDLRQLASDRASSVINKLSKVEGLSTGRFFVVEGNLIKSEGDKQHSARVDFILRPR